MGLLSCCQTWLLLLLQMIIIIIIIIIQTLITSFINTVNIRSWIRGAVTVAVRPYNEEALCSAVNTGCTPVWSDCLCQSNIGLLFCWCLLIRQAVCLACTIACRWMLTWHWSEWFDVCRSAAPPSGCRSTHCRLLISARCRALRTLTSFITIIIIVIMVITVARRSRPVRVSAPAYLLRHLCTVCVVSSLTAVTSLPLLHPHRYVSRTTLYRGHR